MKTWNALLIKFALTLLFALVSFLWFAAGNPWSWIVGVAFAVTVINYLIGDLVILPATGNLIASLADGGLAALIAYGMSLITAVFQVGLFSLIVFGVLVAAEEYYLHLYLLRHREVAP